MILFLGEKSRGWFCEEFCQANGMKMDYIKSYSDIKEQMPLVAKKKEEGVEHIVYDINQYTGQATEIADVVVRLTQACNARPIIYAQGFVPDSTLVVALRNAGVKAFIFTTSPGKKKEELKKFVTDYLAYATLEACEVDRGELELEVTLQPKAQIEENITRPIRSIGVAGTLNRIGTTTQALQIVKSYLFLGYKAAYIQLDGSDFVENIEKYFEDVKTDQELGQITYNHVDMFHDPDQLPKILEMDYDVYIYDYGVFGAPRFNKISFLEKDVTIVCAGAKPNEIAETTKILQSAFYSDVNYVFSFVAKAEQRDVLELMDEKADKTFFAGYTPEQFTYNPESAFYQELFKIENKNPDVKKSKFLFFKNKIFRNRTG